MAKKYLLFLCFVLFPIYGGNVGTAQKDASRFYVNVVMVQLNVAVTDNKGRYVSGLHPEDFSITEDNIPQKMATFEEGNQPAQHLLDATPSHNTLEAQGQDKAKPWQSSLVPPGITANTSQDGPGGTSEEAPNIFILFDTSNYMYRGFVFAQDSISDFIRSLEGVNKVALYSYSRDLDRVNSLTPDRSQVLRAVRKTVAGDDAALYNALLLTVKDAAQLRGKKAIVVFSNGPDNASLVPPEDVQELAQSTGTIIYMISTQAAEAEPISTAVFTRMSKATGGRAYFSKSWRDEKQAFLSIRDDLAHLYTLSYYPQTNPNRGWRKITVKLVGKNLHKYHIRTRDGYRLLNQTQLMGANYPSPGALPPSR